MTGRQKSKLAMFEAAEGVCSQYRHVWNQLPAFREAFACFQKQLDALVALAKSQRRHTGGAAQVKVREREALCALAFEVAAGVRASALSFGNTKRADQVGFSLTKLRIGKDELCLERCRQIMAAAGSEPELERFGITEDRLETLSRAIEAFAAAVEQTRNLRSANKSLTSQLPMAFSAVEQILYNQLDNLMPQFRTSAPRFYNSYQESRVMRPATSEKTSTFFVTETEEPQLLD